MLALHALYALSRTSGGNGGALPSLDELKVFLAKEFPQATMELISVGNGVARGRQSIGNQHLRPGGTVSGPAMMQLADAVTYMAILSEIGIVPLAVTTDLSISFLRKPKADCALIGEAKMLRLGPRLAFADVKIMSEGYSSDEDIVAQATVTYAIPG